MLKKCRTIPIHFPVCFFFFVLPEKGTLVQGAFVDRKCAIGLILGTGSNACYIERADRIEKWEGEHKDVKEVSLKSLRTKQTS